MLANSVSRLFVPAVLLCSQCAFASSESQRCDDRILEHVGKHFGFAHFQYPDTGMHDGLIAAGVCKPSPDDPSKVIATLAYDGGHEYQKDWLVVLVDSYANKVLASYRSVIEEDAVVVVDGYSLRIDTGRYFLSKSNRAFGIRQSTFRWRCTFEAGNSDELTLFVVEGDVLRPVLSETMKNWKVGPGNLCGGEAVNQINVENVIRVEPTLHHGFADLRITAIPDDGGRSISAIVRYDGTRYDLGAWHAEFSAWWDSLQVAEVPETALLTAVGSNDMARVIELLDRGIDVNAYRNTHSTPVHVAAAAGDLAMLELLIKRGADVNARRQQGNRPLHEAAEAGNLKVVQWLLDHGANADALGNLELTPLHLAASKRHKVVVEMLLQRGANVSVHPELRFPSFHYAAMGGDPDIMRLMLRRGAGIDTHDRNGYTPLHRAASSGHKAAVALLLDGGAQIDERDKQLQTPLHLAMSAGRTEVVAYLIERGADPLLRDDKQVSALERARQSKLTEIVSVIAASLGSNDEAAARERDAKIDEFVNAAMRGNRSELERLLDGGVDINAINRYGRTALLQAAMMDDLDIVNLLLKRGALAHPNHNGTTPMHIAAQRGWGALVNVLLAANVDPDIQDLDGRTPLYLALLGGYSRVVELLIDENVDLHAIDSRANNLLHVAARNGNLESVRTLLDHSVAVNAGNREGATPLHYAVQSDAHDVVALLLANSADVNASTEESTQSPLRLAVEKAISNPHGLGTVRLLLAHGADMHYARPQEDSVFQRVQLSGNKELIDLFADADAERP